LPSASLGFVSILLTVIAVNRIRSKKRITHKNRPVSKSEKNIIEELFLKDEELLGWPKYQHTQTAGHRDIPLGQIREKMFNPPSVSADIAERRKYPRADIRNARGILNRALVGSKTQPFKHIRINDISKGGLSFLVKSREIKFRAPTIVKLYFSNSTKPVDLWVRIVWEKNDLQNEGKNVGARFTKVPKESWEKITEAFGHRLG
jgi:hypothetical protein